MIVFRPQLLTASFELISESLQKLLDLCRALRFRLLVNTVQKRHFQPIIALSDCFIGAKHKFLDYPLGFAAQGDERIRAELAAIADGPDGRARLHDMLAQVDPHSAARLHPNDVRRVSRALEIYRLTGRTQTEQAALDASRSDGPFDARIFAPDWPREELYARIDHRVDDMLARGLVEQVQALMRDEAEFSTAAQAIGYKEIASALRGKCSMEQAVETLKQATRNYAKRQLTWFRRDARVCWIAASGRSAAQIAQEILQYDEENTRP